MKGERYFAKTVFNHLKIKMTTSLNSRFKIMFGFLTGNVIFIEYQKFATTPTHVFWMFKFSSLYNDFVATSIRWESRKTTERLATLGESAVGSLI